MTADGVTKFFDDFAAGKLKPYVKSLPRPPNDLEPWVPGCHRITAISWKELVVQSKVEASDEMMNVFVQEFADWCPYCVMMHPFVNNLSWVMEPVKNVRVGKIDQSANDTSGGMAAYLKSKGP